MDVINVIDIEATCWDDLLPGVKPDHEIIEIGNCQLDTRTNEILTGTSIIVKPTTTEVTAFCTTLTGHTAESLERDGIPFVAAIIALRRRLKTGKFLWASWGDFDKHIFEKQCKREGVNYPFGPTHFNVKALYALLVGRRKQCSVEEAIDELGWKFEGRPHNAQADTNNTARILAWVLSTMRVGVPPHIATWPGNEQLRGR